MPCAQIILPASLGAGNTISMVNITLPLVSVLLSMALGGFGGLMLGAMLRIGPGTPVSAGSGGIMAGAGRVQAGGLPVSAHEVHSGGRTRMFAVLALSTGVFQVRHVAFVCVEESGQLRQYLLLNKCSSFALKESCVKLRQEHMPCMPVALLAEGQHPSPVTLSPDGTLL